jgi:predicted nucleic acid-binding protein
VSAYYLDTSAAVKLYVSEPGSDWLGYLLTTNPFTVAVSSHLLRVEMWSAFARRLREGTVTSEEYNRINVLFIQHRYSLYRFVPTDETVIQSTRQLIEHYTLRAIDAVHLATALAVNRRLVGTGEAETIFLCADDRLLAAAAAEGLTVDNPNRH